MTNDRTRQYFLSRVRAGCKSGTIAAVITLVSLSIWSPESLAAPPATKSEPVSAMPAGSPKATPTPISETCYHEFKVREVGDDKESIYGIEDVQSVYSMPRFDERPLAKSFGPYKVRAFSSSNKTLAIFDLVSSNREIIAESDPVNGGGGTFMVPEATFTFVIGSLPKLAGLEFRGPSAKTSSYNIPPQKLVCKAHCLQYNMQGTFESERCCAGLAPKRVEAGKFVCVQK